MGLKMTIEDFYGKEIKIIKFWNTAFIFESNGILYTCIQGQVEIGEHEDW